jgi:hypothetical protein
LTIHQLNVLNQHAVHINGLGPTTSTLEMWSPEGSVCHGDRLSVRLDADVRELVVSHTGAAFVGVFRVDDHDVALETLYPANIDLLANVDNLPTKTAVTEYAVPVAEGDVLVLLLPHTRDWALIPVNLTGALTCADSSSQAEFRRWAISMDMLFPNKNVTVVMASIGWRAPGAPPGTYTVLHSDWHRQHYPPLTEEADRAQGAPTLRRTGRGGILFQSPFSSLRIGSGSSALLALPNRQPPSHPPPQEDTIEAHEDDALLNTFQNAIIALHGGMPAITAASEADAVPETPRIVPRAPRVFDQVHPLLNVPAVANAAPHSPEITFAEDETVEPLAWQQFNHLDDDGQPRQQQQGALRTPENVGPALPSPTAPIPNRSGSSYLLNRHRALQANENRVFRQILPSTPEQDESGSQIPYDEEPIIESAPPLDISTTPLPPSITVAVDEVPMVSPDRNSADEAKEQSEDDEGELEIDESEEGKEAMDESQRKRRRSSSDHHGQPSVKRPRRLD